MDARRALLTRLFDHAPLFPPAAMSLRDALAEDERARASADAWILGRFVVPLGTEVEGRELAIVDGGTETQGGRVFVEGVSKIRCGGARVPSVEELAGFVREARARGILFKATAGLHHAYPTGGEHGFLNLLAAAVFGDEEDALRAARGAFALDAASFRWSGRSAGAGELADVRARLIHSIGSCSFFDPVGELHALGVL
ncbi:MAG: hypothetical protein KGI93_03720 [Acidobacteriota bacterium]|nr:hypothetical protein [Acidobacteriota bacterium]MDE3191934.1 hypothetical protein [Acidobacteriota bacterium]